MHKPIQVVDESGVMTGLAASPRDALLASQIRLVSRVIITDGNGRYLLQKRADDMFIYPGYWDSSAAGHVDEGELPEEAAYRELAEEIGITDIVLKEVGQSYDEVEENHGYASKIYSHIYTGTFTGDITTLALEPSEVTRVQWFSKDAIMQMIENHEKLTHGVKLTSKFV